MVAPLDTPWTLERTAELKKLWQDDGRSAGQIAAQFGVTRNAVIGKIGRLGLSGKGSRKQDQHCRNAKLGIERTPRRTMPHRSAATYSRPAAPPPKIELTEPESKRLTLLDLTRNACRWPGDDGPIWTYCGADRIPDSSYCEFHHGIAYERVSASEANRRLAFAANYR